MTANAALSLRGVSAGYGPVDVLHDVDLEVETGGFLAVLGANGAGKTTLLRAISGTVRRSGSILLDGTEISSAAPDSIVKLGVAHVPQGRGTFGRLTVEENLLVAGSRQGLRKARAALREAYDEFPVLAERRSMVASSLSGGEQQMLAIGRAMLLRPRVMLLDEPSLGLAPKITEQVFELVARLHRQRDISVVVVEQNAELSMAFARRVVVLESGRVSVNGSPEELRDSDVIRRAYLGAGA